MNTITYGLKEVKDLSTLPFIFFEEQPKKTYKVYNDGGHFIASLPTKKNKISQKSVKSELDIYFDELYDEARVLDLSQDEMFYYIKELFIKKFGDEENIDNYIKAQLKRKLHNFYLRKKRFRRKAYLNKWTHFVTFTYDDSIMDEVSFEKKLKNCLSHLQCRRGWRFQGKFERAPETKRLHFHGLAYIPNGEMPGKIVEKEEYSTAQHKMITIFENSFFRKGYGRNDFEKIDDYLIKQGKTLDYILKYIQKDTEHIIYSRGIPTEIMLEISDDEIITEMQDFITKFILFDDVVSWERDILSTSKYHKNE